MTAALDFAPATPVDLPAVVALLAEAGLPHADLSADGLAHFVLARDARQLVGAAGLEVYGRWGLLRSLVVAPGARGSGLGGRLVAAVEADARALGLDTLVLLTTTAEAFFAARGYARTDRAEVPAEVRGSTEFAALCPASAACLSKPLP